MASLPILEKLTEIISVPVETMGFELVGVKFTRELQLTLRIYIDINDDITIDNYADVS